LFVRVVELRVINQICSAGAGPGSQASGRDVNGQISSVWDLVEIKNKGVDKEEQQPGMVEGRSAGWWSRW
jgi:hypothetical protein